VLAAGFNPGTDDQAFDALLVSLGNQINTAIDGINQINPAAVLPADITNLQTILTNSNTLAQQLTSLNPSVYGVTVDGPNIDAILSYEIPQLLDATKNLANGILQQAQTLQPQVRLADPRVSSGTFFNNFFTMFGIATDLAGTALKDIITLILELANDLVNIALANLINQNAGGALTIDVVQGAASLSFICPNYPSSLIEGAGYSSDPTQMKVALIGCLDASYFTNLVTLRSCPNLINSINENNGGDVAACIRLGWKIFSIAKSIYQAAKGEGPAAVATPDSVQMGVYDSNELDLIFTNGWPSVNQGPIPCLGTIFLQNLSNGSFVATNVDFLGSCGP